MGDDWGRTVTSDAVSSDSRSGLAWVPDLQPLAAWNDAEAGVEKRRRVMAQGCETCDPEG